MTALLEVTDMVRHFRMPGSLWRAAPVLRAVDGVSFAVEAGEVLGLVGESGSGKSTIGNLTLRLDQPTAGRIIFDGEDITHARDAELRAFRRRATSYVAPLSWAQGGGRRCAEGGAINSCRSPITSAISARRSALTV